VLGFVEEELADRGHPRQEQRVGRTTHRRAVELVAEDVEHVVEPLGDIDLGLGFRDRCPGHGDRVEQLPPCLIDPHRIVHASNLAHDGRANNG
jgi:hypothetical protein